MLGKAKKVMIDKENTTIVNGAGKKKDIEGRIAQIKAEIEETIATKANPKYTAKMFRLFDLNENREYGSFYQRSDTGIPMDCNVLDTACHSQAEWDVLISRYMEDKE